MKTVFSSASNHYHFHRLP